MDYLLNSWNAMTNGFGSLKVLNLIINGLPSKLKKQEYKKRYT